MGKLLKKAEVKQAAYERRLILFVDFLGFKEVVAGTTVDQAKLDELIDALNEIGSIGELTSGSSQVVTQFSDSVVVSFRVTETSAVFWLINAIALIVITLVERGFLLRGAVTIGKLLHTERHVVGPAMVKAYEMESRIARHPRVIVDPKVLKAARRYRQPGHSPSQEERYVRSFLSEDEDGHLFIDYAAWRLVVEVAGIRDESYPDYLRILSGIVRRGLSHDDPSVIRKHLWLHARYLDALDWMAGTPKASPHRLADPDYHGAIAALPRLRRRARAASDRLSAAERQLKLGHRRGGD